MALTSKPVFVHAPHPGLPFVVETNSSCFTTGGVLFQCGARGARQVVAYSSHKMRPPELLYPPHEQEMLAVVVAL